MNKKTFRSVLIDPARCTVEVHNTTGSHEDTVRLLGCGALDHLRMADHGDSWDYGWVDDAGLKRGLPIDAFLFMRGPDPIAGRCLLVGVDKKTGAATDAKFPVEVLRGCIEWLGQIVPEVTWDEKENVTTAIVTYARVKA